jgi:hypothetical protein
VPSQKSIEQGYEIAKLTAICLLASLKQEVGDLKKVKRVVKVLGMVLSDQGFDRQPAVINGASDLFVKVFGDRGKARAIGGRDVRAPVQHHDRNRDDRGGRVGAGPCPAR